MNGYKDLTEHKASELTTILKRDIDWILAHRKLKFEPQRGCRYRDGAFVTVKNSNDEDICATCIVGTNLLRHQPRISAAILMEHAGEIIDIDAFAHVHDCSYAAAEGIYYGAILSEDQFDRVPRACLVAVDVLRHAMRHGWNPEDERYGDDLNSYESRLHDLVDSQ